MKELTFKEAMDALKYGGEIIVESADGSQKKIIVEQDDMAGSPREEFGNPCTIISGNRGSWAIGDKGCTFDRDTWREKVEALEADPDTYIVPVYIYEHSGMAISLNSFNDPWDSGVGAHVFMTKQQVFDIFGGEATEENWKEKAAEGIKQEIELYDYYIRGEVYGFQICEPEVIEHKNLKTHEIWTTVDWDEVDSCYGFYGPDVEENGMLEYFNLKDDDKFFTV